MSLPFCGQMLISTQSGESHKVLAVMGTYADVERGGATKIRVQVDPCLVGHHTWDWCDIDLFDARWRTVKRMNGGKDVENR